MHRHITIAGTVLSAALTTVLLASTASAQPWPVRDRARLRYGIALEGGGLFAPGVADLGTLGLQAQLGVQASNLLGVYAVPSVDLVSGRSATGVRMGGALLVDFTLAHVITVGIGPDLSGFVAVGGDEVSGGMLFGARLHLAVNPFVSITRGVRRQALVIGLDLLLGGVGGASVLTSRGAAAADLVAAPTLTIGYQAF